MVALAASRCSRRTGPVLGVTPTGDRWTDARVPIESIDHAHGEFLRLGAGIEALAPAELRDRIAATVRTLATRYGSLPDC